MTAIQLIRLADAADATLRRRAARERVITARKELKAAICAHREAQRVENLARNAIRQAADLAGEQGGGA